jgi:two-component system response regulator YesN
MPEEQQSHAAGPLPSPRSVRHPTIRRALEFIEENFSSPDLGVEAVAAAVFLSKHHFSRLFRKVVGLTFREYLVRLRVRRAAELIAMEPYRPVTDVAFAVGFKSVRTFEVEFKRVMGEAPSEHRRRHRPR